MSSFDSRKSLNFRDFRTADVVEAHALSTRIGWPQRIEDWQWLAAQGDGYVATLDGKLAGVTLYWRFGEQWAIRHGDWKLLVGNGGGREPELYNLASDIGESKNLATTNPAKAKELHAKLVAWRTAIKAPMPQPNKPDAAAATEKKKGKGKKKAAKEKV